MSDHISNRGFDLEIIMNMDSARNRTSCANYFHLRPRDKNIRWTGNTACHAQLKRWDTKVEEDDVFVSLIQYKWKRSFLLDEGEYVKASIKWIDFLVNESPFAIAFLEKDANVIWENQSFVLDVKCPNNLFAAAAIQSRRLWEHNGDVWGWYKMVEAGINPHLAMLFSHFVDGVEAKPYCNIGQGNGHRALDVGNMSGEDVINFMEGNIEYAMKDKPYYQDSTYDKVSALFIRTKGNKIRNFLTDHNKEAFDYACRIKQEEGKVCLNPFVKSIKVGRGNAYETLEGKRFIRYFQYMNEKFQEEIKLHLEKAA